MKKIKNCALAILLSMAFVDKTYSADEMMRWPIPVGPIQEMTYTPAATRFSLWSPAADSVRVNIYPDGKTAVAARHMLARQNDGTWTATLKGDCKGKFYTFQIKTASGWQAETPGIFAKAVGLNGQRAQVLDMRTTDPVGWESDKSPACNGANEIVLYEMHHRDMSIDEASGIRNKGKFLALTEHGTTNPDGLSTGIDHLKELGITHVHLLPSYDYGSIDERTGIALGGGGRNDVSSYNWGYDPVNYNVPEGSYSTNAADPAVRVREFKQMVMALHKAGIRVVMDVVYNHVFDLMQSQFQKTAPDYFFRWKDRNGKAQSPDAAKKNKADDGVVVPANGSGCGNETASEMPMMRKYMVESVMYWMKEYHIDGFRFDLMGIHDIETMNAIRDAAQSIDPNVFIYGEGWAAETPMLAQEKLAMKANTSQLGGIAAFGDEMRDGLRGGWQNDAEGAFLIANAGNEESVKFGIVGGIQHDGVDYTKVNYSKEPWAAQPTQMISYVSCHDDMCLADRIKCTLDAKTKNSASKSGKAKSADVSKSGKAKATDAAKSGNEKATDTAKSGNDKADAAAKAECIRLQKLAETVVLTSQGVPFVWCGDEVMRDKKGVHNSFASPDSINKIPWAQKTEYKELFDYVKSLIAMRKSHTAFRMGDADAVRHNLSFLPIAKGQHNVIAYSINGEAVGDSWKDIIVILNSNTKSVTQAIPQGEYTVVCNDGKINLNGLATVKGKKVVVPAQSALIMYR